MEPPAAAKSSRLTARNFFVKLFLVGIFFLVLRFVYVVSFHGESCEDGDFCFLSSQETVAITGAGVTTGTKAFVRGGDAPAAGNPQWSSREWRKAVDFYSLVFQNLIKEGLLSTGWKSLCVGSPVGQEVFALKEIGVSDAIGIGKKKSPPLVVSGDLLNQPFGNDTFDFIFSGVGTVESSKTPASVAMELVRIAKPGSFLVFHTSSGDMYSLNSFTALFPSCRLVRSRQVDEMGSVRQIVLQKEEETEGVLILGRRGKEKETTRLSSDGDLGNKCSMHKVELVESAEPLITEEPLKPWITLKKNIKNIKYLPSMVDISFKRRYVYIDIGARSYGSSIGSWFKKQYPKQDRAFEVYAIEADSAFHAEYATKKGVKLMPYAAWVRNETLSFEVSHGKDDHESEGKGLGMGRIRAASESSAAGNFHSIQGFDFAEWLKNTVSETDFVVMKMDVEGTEFNLIPRLIESGAICLVDELFLECHYNRWQRCCPGVRSPKYQKTYGQCLDLFSSLRESGVLVHQWW